MESAVAIDVLRGMVLTCMWIAAPLLLACLVGGVIFNLIQVATSIQDPGFSSIPRFAICAICFLLLLPWMLHQAGDYMLRVARGIASGGL